tara:strand:- start:1108 stop:2406 length:1299 start_codon:yes stop_codon:yes gene_type:complete
MEKIKYINKDFDFNGLSLAHPNGLQGGSYFTKLSVNNESLYLQTKRCKTKQGIVKTVKKTYCDLMFDKNDSDVVDWFENLEERLIELIYEKRNLWFHNELDKEDISSSFSSPIRTYKSGKFYLVRVHLSHANILSSGEFNCYDEQGQTVDPNTLNDQDIKVIPLIEIQGVKFSSRNFSVEISLKQMMVLKKEEDTFNKCLITIPTNSSNEKVELSNEIDSLDSSDVKEEDDSNKEVIVEATDNNKEETNDDNKEETNDNENVKIELSELSSNDSSSIQSSENDTTNEEVTNVTDAILEENSDNNDKKLDNSSNEIQEKEISLEIEDLESNDDNKPKGLEEFEVSLETLDVKDSDVVKLRQPNEVYMEIWREARKRAKQARKAAIEAYLEAKNIKSTYMINEIDNSDSEDEIDNIVNSMDSEDMGSKSMISLG